MKNRARILAVMMSFAMLLGAFALAIPVSAAVQKIEMAKNTNVEVDGIVFRFDPLGTHPNSKAEVNADGTLTLTMREGDLFWIPSVEMDEQSRLDISVLMVSNNGGKNKGQMASGPAWNINAGDNNAWGEDADSAVVLNLQTAARRRICKVTTYQMVHDGSPEKVGVQAGNTDNNSTLASFIGEERLWKSGSTLRMKVYVGESDEKKYVYGDICNESEERLTFDYYELTSSAPKNLSGPVGYCVNWDGDGSDDGDMVITIKNFTIKNALVNGERRDFNLKTALDVTKLDPPNLSYAKEIEAEFYGSDSSDGEVDLTMTFAVDASVPETAELVVQRGADEIARVAISSLEKNEFGKVWSASLQNIAKTEELRIWLEQDGTALERSNLVYAVGAAYLNYLAAVAPVSESELNAVRYSENFDGLNLTLEPGENIVNGQRWLYIRNSEDGSARISDGKLYITGNSYDRILFLDQVYDHINYRFYMEINYATAPEKVEENGKAGYVGGIFNLQEADASGKQNAVITAVTPDYLYLKQVVFNADGTFSPKDERGDCPIGTKNDAGLWSQYFTAVKPGETFALYAYSGISGMANGCFGIKPRTLDDANRGWGNCYGVSGSFRTGIMGIFLGEGQASAFIDNIKVEVKGKVITVDGEEFPITNSSLPISSLQRADEKLVYALVNGAVKTAKDTISAGRSTVITTSQIGIKTRKAAADGETGLIWKTEINKADYDRLAADPNIKEIRVGTVVVPTTATTGGFTKETAGAADIAASSGWSAQTDSAYTFEGVRTIAKAERDISYSGVGYLSVTMKDGTVITVYSDYVMRNHAYALSDFVSVFHDPDPTPADSQNNTDDATQPAKEKKGCGSTVGTSAILILAVLGGACFLVGKKKKERRS